MILFSENGGMGFFFDYKTIFKRKKKFIDFFFNFWIFQFSLKFHREIPPGSLKNDEKSIKPCQKVDFRPRSTSARDFFSTRMTPTFYLRFWLFMQLAITHRYFFIWKKSALCFSGQISFKFLQKSPSFRVAWKSSFPKFGSYFWKFWDFLNFFVWWFWGPKVAKNDF